MAQFHFVEDYERYVAHLVNTMPIDEAMSAAVGGGFEQIGRIEVGILQHCGLQGGSSIVDLGCGSGRLAVPLSRAFEVDYLGLDVVQALLDYAASKCPAHYRFVLNHRLSIPAADGSVDIACAFSVFTHLLHTETYLYLRDMHRCLKAGGRVVFSFLEFAIPSHWTTFAATVQQQEMNTVPHLNQFLERNQIAEMARQIGFATSEFHDGDRPLGPSGLALGQSTAVLTK